MTVLCDIAKKYGTDKFEPHEYTPIYDQLLRDRVDRVRTVLEIGIAHGRSLRMWEEYFQRARIYGVDKRVDTMLNEGRITSFLGQQTSYPRMTDIAEKIGAPLDVVVDDGAHDAVSQAIAMITLIPHLASDGIYFIEDVRDDPTIILRHVPSKFAHSIYEGKKILPSGQGEKLMVLRPC